MEDCCTVGQFRMFRSRYAAGECMPPHRDPGARVSVVLRGSVRESACRQEETGVPASVVVKPAGVAHANVFGPAGAHILSMETSFPSRAFDRWRWLHGGPVSIAAVELVAALNSVLEEPERVEEAALALFAALAGVAPPRSGPTPRWLVRVRERLDQEFTASCSVQSLAADAGVHPVYLTRIFRQHYQRSVTGYARGLRVRAAAERLASTGTPMARVAQDAGFADQSHMCRVFKTDIGVSPGHFRALMRAG